MNFYFQDQQGEGPPLYEHIYMNEFVYRKHVKQEEEDIVVCVCQFDANDPDSACGERCLNVLTSTECTPGYCPCGVYCKNQKFQKCEYPILRLFKTEDRGWGLLAAQNIEAGQFVIEYCGEVISWKEAEQRSQLYESKGLRDAYIISLNGNESIDATRKGSLARFINHSCPTARRRKWTVSGEIRVGIFAKQDIPAGTELSYDYNFEWYGGAKVRCLCGAPSCSGFLGAKSRGFQRAFAGAFYLWKTTTPGDDPVSSSYSVDNIPLYDSGEDDPSLKLPKPPAPATGTAAEDGVSGSLTSPMVIEPLNSVRIGSGDGEAAAAGSRRCTRRRPTTKKDDDEGAACLLFALQEAKEEAAAALEALYDEIRPAIEEHERDTQDSVSTSVAEKWIEASCRKLKAEFDLYAAVVKGVTGNPRPLRRGRAVPPVTEGEDNGEIKYLEMSSSQ
ncbi:unnamed protein product [Spirodela intermedia]|uniref:Uncharacterized protein n=1 Tax=Spirodela intermedia TaxID=51605 RepID=A0A7I8J1E8_SPIIN|nr:unnamed protein product [Spirodela intermedia]CAA6663792.1 unnamed protein product [Spirodela intermedia]